MNLDNIILLDTHIPADREVAPIAYGPRLFPDGPAEGRIISYPGFATEVRAFARVTTDPLKLPGDGSDAAVRAAVHDELVAAERARRARLAGS